MPVFTMNQYSITTVCALASMAVCLLLGAFYAPESVDVSQEAKQHVVVSNR